MARHGVPTHLEKRHGHTEGHAGASKRPLVLLDRPRIPGQLLEDTGELELARLDGHEELGCRGGGHGLAGPHGLHRTGRGVEA